MGKVQRRRLRVLRAEQDVRQSDVAHKAGLSRSRYAQIETGEGSVPRDDEKQAVAAALNVRVSEIDWPLTYTELRA
jgi:transcriptional regulator with XRE-family HTH domain